MKEYICIYDDDDMQYIPSPHEEKTELVRCKNCRFWPKAVTFLSRTDSMRQAYLHCFEMDGDDFCSKGKEREE